MSSIERWRKRCAAASDVETCDALQPCIWQPLSNNCAGPFKKQKKRTYLLVKYGTQKQQLTNRVNTAITQLLAETTAQRTQKLQSIKKRQDNGENVTRARQQYKMEREITKLMRAGQQATARVRMILLLGEGNRFRTLTANIRALRAQAAPGAASAAASGGIQNGGRRTRKRKRRRRKTRRIKHRHTRKHKRRRRKKTRKRRRR